MDLFSSRIWGVLQRSVGLELTEAGCRNILQAFWETLDQRLGSITLTLDNNTKHVNALEQTVSEPIHGIASMLPNSNHTVEKKRWGL